MPPARTSLYRWSCTALALSLAAACACARKAESPSPLASQSTTEESARLAGLARDESASHEQAEVAEAYAPAPAAESEAMEGDSQAFGEVGGVIGASVNAPPPSAAVAPPPAQPLHTAPRADMTGKGAGGLGRGAALPQKKVMAPREVAPPEPTSTGNSFVRHEPHAFTETARDSLSTFAVDVDTASYTVARRYLNEGRLPPPAAVRVEEFVNYFKYRYTPPEKGAFTVHLEGAPSPFASGRHFLRVGVQGKVVSRSQRKPAHLVFLVDTSGSMSSTDKLPLAKEAMKIAVKNLLENDTVALVTYAGGTRDVLPPTPATSYERIYQAIDSLESGGGTAMGSGMELAYKHAVRKASGSVVSRVVVLTDGDTNIGPNLTPESMLESIGRYVAEGVTLTMVGFGMGNYRDDLMEKLADKGNGNCFYIDSYKEAKKVFEAQLTGTLEVIAKDVKLQVEFSPQAVRRYRLVGYENRDVADQDFRNDKVDAGEIGAGHSVTALYEVELAGEGTGPLGTVRIRAKQPTGTEAAEQAFPFERQRVRPSLEAASADLRFALAVAATADVLRDSPAARGWSLALAQRLAEGASEGLADRLEFSRLLARARSLKGQPVAGGTP